MLGLVDSDLLCYRVGFGSENDSLYRARQSLDGFIYDLMLFHLPDVFEWEFHLTGKKNFRDKIAITQPYKGNRAKQKKPKHLNGLRKHLVDKWQAIMHHKQEADDGLAIRQYELGDDSIIISVDKDLDMVTGWHYNFVKQERYYMTKEEGLHKFYTQLLTGDRVDNIKGVTGIGPVKASKLLEGCKTALDKWLVCLEAHDSRERAIEDGILLWMRSTEDEIWLPPDS